MSRGPLSSRELDETLARSERVAEEELARELFAHGLLLAQADEARPGAAFRREQRIGAILERLHGPAGDGTRPPRVVLRWVKLAGAAAAILAAFALWFAWPRDDSRAFAEKLVQRAVTGTTSGVHIFEVDLETSRFRSTWRAALGPDRRWNVRQITGSQPFVNGTELGSDGKTVWIRAPNGYAFELFVDPRQIELTGLGPVIGYYELRPFLETVLQELEVTVASRDADRVRLTGSYRRELVAAGKGAKRGRHPKWRTRDRFLGESGHIELVVDEDSGHLLEIELRQTAPHAGRIHVRREPTPENLSGAGFEFDPRRVRVAPGYKFWTWMGLLRRAWARTRSHMEPSGR